MDLEKEYSKALEELVDICRRKGCKTAEDISITLNDYDWYITEETLAITSGYQIVNGASSLEEAEDMLNNDILKELNKTI